MGSRARAPLELVKAAREAKLEGKRREIVVDERQLPERQIESGGRDSSDGKTLSSQSASNTNQFVIMIATN